jgi:hypothetical protein
MDDCLHCRRGPSRSIGRCGQYIDGGGGKHTLFTIYKCQRCGSIWTMNRQLENSRGGSFFNFSKMGNVQDRDHPWNSQL